MNSFYLKSTKGDKLERLLGIDSYIFKPGQMELFYQNDTTACALLRRRVLLDVTENQYRDFKEELLKTRVFFVSPLPQ